jgi:hypothetical protein
MSTTFTVDPATDLNSKFAVAGPMGIVSFVDQWYCATPAKAAEFVTYLKQKLNIDATVSFGWPVFNPAPGSPFLLTGMVPYIDFAGADASGNINGNPYHNNAAQLFTLYYFFQDGGALGDQRIRQWFTPPAQ